MTREPRFSQIKPSEVIDVLSTVYTVTEIYSFLANLARAGLYEEGVTIDIAIKNTKERKLVIFDPMRAPLFNEYKTHTDVIEVPKKTVTKEEILTKYLDLALDDIIYICQQFNWDNPPIETLRGDQKKLIERKL